MRYHIEHAKYKYEQITVTGWLAGETAQEITEIWVEDHHGVCADVQIQRTEREDVRAALFPQETACDFGFRLKFSAKEDVTYTICFGAGQTIRRLRTGARQLQKHPHIADNWKESLRRQLHRVTGKDKHSSDNTVSPYEGEFLCGTRKAAGERKIKEKKTGETGVTFSFVVPAYETRREHMADLLESLFEQTYDNWELCLADGSPVSMKDAWATGQDGVSRRLTEWMKDPRVKYVHLSENRGISGNTNAALALAEGEFVVMVDHDDVLTSDALEALYRVLEEDPDTDFIYSDSDLTDHDHLYCYNPLFKPVWSPEMLYSANYITHLSVVRRTLLHQIGGWRAEYDGAQDWDLFLRIGETTDRIRRISRVLYHWRAADGSTARNVEEKPYARIAQLKAVQDHLDRRGIPGQAAFVDRHSTCIRIKWEDRPNSTGERDGVSVPDVLIRTAPGVTLSEDTAAELRFWASQPGMGVICPRVVDPKGRILSQGLLLKKDGPVPLFAGCYPGIANLWGHTDWYRNHVAAEPFCYAVSRALWDELGGVDESLKELGVLDLCLRAQRAGRRNLMTPFGQITADHSSSADIGEKYQKEYHMLLKKYQL